MCRKESLRGSDSNGDDGRIEIADSSQPVLGPMMDDTHGDVGELVDGDDVCGSCDVSILLVLFKSLNERCFFVAFPAL